MKIVILFGAILAAQLFFSSDCHAQAIGGGGSGGGGLLSAVKYGCIEGRVTLISMRDNDDRGTSRLERRTCVNGSYMTPEERAKYIYRPKIRCKEGARNVTQERDDLNDTSMTVVRVCSNGKWVQSKWSAAAKQR